MTMTPADEPTIPTLEEAIATLEEFQQEAQHLTQTMTQSRDRMNQITLDTAFLEGVVRTHQLYASRTIDGTALVGAVQNIGLDDEPAPALDDESFPTE